jgi:hypothetical protein
MAVFLAGPTELKADLARLALEGWPHHAAPFAMFPTPLGDDVMVEPAPLQGSQQFVDKISCTIRRL